MTEQQENVRRKGDDETQENTRTNAADGYNEQDESDETSSAMNEEYIADFFGIPDEQGEKELEHWENAGHEEKAARIALAYKEELRRWKDTWTEKKFSEKIPFFDEASRKCGFFPYKKLTLCAQAGDGSMFVAVGMLETKNGNFLVTLEKKKVTLYLGTDVNDVWKVLATKNIENIYVSSFCSYKNRLILCSSRSQILRTVEVPEDFSPFQSREETEKAIKICEIVSAKFTEEDGFSVVKAAPDLGGIYALGRSLHFFADGIDPRHRIETESDIVDFYVDRKKVYVADKNDKIYVYSMEHYRTELVVGRLALYGISSIAVMHGHLFVGLRCGQIEIFALSDLAKSVKTLTNLQSKITSMSAVKQRYLFVIVAETGSFRVIDTFALSCCYNFPGGHNARISAHSICIGKEHLFVISTRTNILSAKEIST